MLDNTFSNISSPASSSFNLFPPPSRIHLHGLHPHKQDISRSTPRSLLYIIFDRCKSRLLLKIPIKNTNDELRILKVKPRNPPKTNETHHKFRALQDAPSCVKAHHHPQLNRISQKDEKERKKTKVPKIMAQAYSAPADETISNLTQPIIIHSYLPIIIITHLRWGDILLRTNVLPAWGGSPDRERKSSIKYESERQRIDLFLISRTSP